jgi:exonuclease III
MLIATFNCNSVRVRLETILAWLDANRPSDHTFVAARFDLQPGR